MTDLASLEFSALLVDNVLTASMRLPSTITSVATSGISCSISYHDEVDSAWIASFPLNSDDGEIWKGSLPNFSDTGCTGGLLEVVQINIVEPPVIGQAMREPFKGGYHYARALAMINSPVDPESGVRIDPFVELDRLLNARNIDLHEVVQGESGGGAKFRAFVIADGCLFTRALRLPGIGIYPISNAARGADVAEILNAAMRQLGSASAIPVGDWMERFARQRPTLVVHLPNILASDTGEAISLARESTRQALNVATLNRGAATSIIGGLIEHIASNGIADANNYWMEDQYQGNLMGGAISGENLKNIRQNWKNAKSDERLSLWLALYADATREQRWDFRWFRIFNLLETVSRELYGESSPVIDFASNPIAKPGRNNTAIPTTTAGAREKVYLLCRNVSVLAHSAESNLCIGSARSLWDEAQVWTYVRNAVAHEGGYRENDSIQNATARNQLVNYAFSNALSINPHIAGRLQYLKAIDLAGKMVVNALIGKLI